MMKDSTEILNTYKAGQKVNYDKVLQEVMADWQLHLFDQASYYIVVVPLVVRIV